MTTLQPQSSNDLCYITTCQILCGEGRHPTLSMRVSRGSDGTQMEGEESSPGRGDSLGKSQGHRELAKFSKVLIGRTE